MLSWARERSGLSLAELAKRMKPVSADRLSAWERDDPTDRPTFKQAQKLADVLRVPFGYLFLSAAPDEKLPLPDLRTKHDAASLAPSPDFLDVIYDALRKQEWYHDYLVSQDAHERPYVGRFSTDTPAKVIANDIRKELRLSNGIRSDSKDSDDYFRRLVRRCEDIGIIVLRNGVVGNNTHRPLDPDEFQGFAIADKLAPVVFINQHDYLSAQVFTLLHEVAHIWLGSTGVSDPEYFDISDRNDKPHQHLADAIAAEVLVPTDEFALRWDGRSDEDIESRLERLRKFYKVSVFVVLRRAYDVGKISQTIFRAHYARLRRAIKPRRTGGGGGYSTIFSRNSQTVTSAVLRSLTAGTLPPTDGALLLNVRATTLYNIQRQLSLSAL